MLRYILFEVVLQDPCIFTRNARTDDTYIIVDATIVTPKHTQAVVAQTYKYLENNAQDLAQPQYWEKGGRGFGREISINDIIQKWMKIKNRIRKVNEN